MTRIVILGGGTAGTMVANRLARLFREQIRSERLSLTVVDQDDEHVYQPGLLFVPFRVYDPAQCLRRRRRLLPADALYVRGVVERVAPDDSVVYLEDGRALPYDVLVVASGARLAPEATEGLGGPGWWENTFEFYSRVGATILAGALDRWDGGHLVVNVVDAPIKSPVAPLEFAFLADWLFRERGIREHVWITVALPREAVPSAPFAADALTTLLDQKRIELVDDFRTARVDGEARRVTSWDGRTLDYDLLVAVPLHRGAAFVGRSPGLGDALGFVRTDPMTLQARRRPNIFALGDAANLPGPKLGSAAAFQSVVVADNVRRFLAGEPVVAGFDGHTSYLVETGFSKAMVLDSSYAVAPLPGKFPRAAGPFDLLRETRLNHTGKMLQRAAYWSVLVRGRELPGIPTTLSMDGKTVPAGPPPEPRRTANRRVEITV